MRVLGNWGTKIMQLVHFASDNSPKIKSLIPATKDFVGNNWLVMFKTSFTVLTLLVFCFALINAESFEAYDHAGISSGTSLGEQTIKDSGDTVAIDLESVSLDIDDGESVGMFTYAVRRGDSPSSIASEFGITTKNLRSVNKLGVNDKLSIGKILYITKVEGFVIQNTAGDMTVEQFALKHRLDLQDLKDVNNYKSDLDVIKMGYDILLPLSQEDGIALGFIKPEPVKPANTIKSTPKKTTITNSAGKKVSTKGYFDRSQTAGYLGFAPYNCTSYVARKLPEIGKAIRGQNGGNAKERYAKAIKAGLRVGKSPSVGAVGVMGTRYGRFGHVGIVTSVGDQVCMNNANVRSLGAISEDCFPKEAFIGYIYGK